MKKEKQLRVLLCLECGRYKMMDGQLYSYRVNTGSWHLKKATILNGYKQQIIYNYKRGDKGLRAVVYEHIIAWMMVNGEYKEGLQIDHKDRDRGNNKIENLRLVTPKGQRISVGPKPEKMQYKALRATHIIMIIKLVKLGYNYSKTADITGFNRLSVMRTYKKYLAGEVFKYLDNKTFENYEKSLI